MDVTSLVLSAAQTLFAALQCSQLKEICSLWGYESVLERLQNTVHTIKSVLLDAEAKEVLSHQQNNYVEKLKGAVYDADDLLDEFTALAEQDGSGIELVQTQLRGQLQGKKYLLILDDVWSENHDEWIKLGNFFMGGGRGSRVVVTTRSKMTAQVVGSNHPFELQGLSEENSWNLFERLAFV